MAYVNDFQIKRAVNLMEQDGVIAYPTEAVFGLGCLPFSVEAIERILAIKKRPWHKGLILVASDIAQIEPFVDENFHDLLVCFDEVPDPEEPDQPVTWLLPKSELVLPLVCGEHPKIAIRLSKHPVVMALCDEAQSVIVSTSANRAGNPEMKRTEDVRNQMTHQLDMVVSGAVGGYDRPSKIIDAQTQKVLRA
ncbi:L-threonylcarbamoyladenylate synthase [Kangiella taiwanensis]|uniref:Threonylcarbamoyl-AMP synthase n=1 Tax=Kangiella taiwanensis TaxID=1079179 RepID=A0ABP8HX53_9GAMM|nr:Sua5/YciO/YrdC/YwlC family protein [Kangiella taiwanensis]